MKRSQITSLFSAVLLFILFSSSLLPCEAAANPSGTNSSAGDLATCQKCWVNCRQNLPDCAGVTDQEWQSIFDVKDQGTLNQTIPQVNGSVTCICSLISNAQHILEDICAPCPYEMVSALANETFAYASVFGCTAGGRSQLVDNYVGPDNTTTTNSTNSTTTDTNNATSTDTTSTNITDGSSYGNSASADTSNTAGNAAADSSTPSIASSSTMHLGPIFVAVIAAIVFI